MNYLIDKEEFIEYVKGCNVKNDKNISDLLHSLIYIFFCKENFALSEWSGEDVKLTLKQNPRYKNKKYTSEQFVKICELALINNERNSNTGDSIISAIEDVLLSKFQ